MFNYEFLKKEHTIAGPGFNRWMVPPAALAIHLCIGMAYGFSVFWLPLSQVIGITAPVAAPAVMSYIARVFSSSYDWPVSMVNIMYTLFFVFLGISAAIWGQWLETAGPRKAGFASTICWCGGLIISAIGVKLHQVWMLWIGSGVIGGIGLGLGYISPVSTLIKWFPDKRGMATGMAIMGFGGGAMIGAPLADTLMNFFSSRSVDAAGIPTSVGVWETFLTLAVIYFIYMIMGAMAYRVPPTGWTPKGWKPSAATTNNTMITKNHVHVSRAWKTPQFWFLWLVLCLNVSAGIGIIGMASPLLQEVFGGKLLGLNLHFNELDAAQKIQIAAIAAGFTGLLSVFNISGRFIWASFSDVIGRKVTFAIFFILGFALYALSPTFGRVGILALFVSAFCICVSMYGGGFATIPAYLADIFGTQMVGAIHGRLLTAWSTAGILGPVLVTTIREYQLARGVPTYQAYNVTLYILACLLVIGLICNLLVRPVNPKHYMTQEELDKVKLVAQKSTEKASAGNRVDMGDIGAGSHKVKIAFAWIAVVIPLIYGFYNTVMKAIVLFQ
jgi:MFS family permease